MSKQILTKYACSTDRSSSCKYSKGKTTSFHDKKSPFLFLIKFHFHDHSIKTVEELRFDMLYIPKFFPSWHISDVTTQLQT